MRLSFANGEHADFVVDAGAVSLGNADGNTVVLPARDVAPWHARITVDPRGTVLEILDPGARTHVNARPVREKALLRCGDVLCLGKVMIALKADSDDVIVTALPPDCDVGAESSDPIPSRVSLRGVSGGHFGKTIAVNRRLLVGRGADCGLVIDEADLAMHHVSLTQVDDAIYLREIDDSGGAVINGVPVRSAVVHPGDQIAFERSHFIVEAPGLPLRGDHPSPHADPATGAVDAVGAGDAGPSPSAQHGIWWLIGAAALIALGFFVLLQRGA